MVSLDYLGETANSLILHQQLFMPKDNQDLVMHFFNCYFNFVPSKEIQLLTFYNYIGLPYFISEQTFQGLFSDNSLITKQALIQKLCDFYFGEVETRTQLLFQILDFNKIGRIQKENAIALFKTFNSMKITFDQFKLEEDGIIIIEYFFGDKNEISFVDYRKLLKEQNADLFYLFYMFYKRNLFFNYQSLLHYSKHFYDKNKHIDEHQQSYAQNNTSVNKEDLYTPSDVLLCFFNNKFGTSFEINEELKELTNFENEMRGIKLLGVTIKKEDHFQKKCDLFSYSYANNSGEFTKQFTCKTEKTKASSNHHPGSSIKLIDYQSCTDKMHCYVDNSEKVYTFAVEWKNKEKYNQYYIDIICDDVYIYNSQKILKIMFPFQHLFIEEEEVIKPSFLGDKVKYPISFYSELNNNLKQCIIYFQNYEDVEKLKQLIHQKIKYFPFDPSRFSNQKLIDKGSFGEIMKAYDNLLERNVAIKIINKQRANRENIKMLRNEQDICSFIAEIKLKGMIYIFDIFENKDNVYIIEELIQDGNLKDYLENTKLNNKQKIEIIKQITESINTLHSRGIVHRDLKLENILVQKNSDGTIQTKIIDFGLSSFFSKNKEMKEKYGTLLYLPPEIILNNPYTEKIDVWDFGIIAYTIANNGKHPFGNETEIQSLLKNIINRKFNYENIDPIFHNLLEQCLKKEKERADIKQVLQLINSLK